MSMNLRNERGFTLAELMVATLITTLVLGGAVDDDVAGATELSRGRSKIRPASRKAATRSNGSAA